MGIFRAGVRVTRALTPTPSSSSSDDEDPRIKKKCKTRNETEKVSRVAGYCDVGKDEAERFQVGDTISRLPEELFELSHLGEVLSLETWNNCLSEEERRWLCGYLPVMDQESYVKTLRELFGRQNLYFGNPLESLWQSLKEGFCDPSVVMARETLKILQRKEYYHDLRQYHNSMVNSLVEMRDLWSRDPGADFEERLRAWQVWKASEDRINASEGVKASAGKLHTKPFVRPGRIADDGATSLGTALSDSPKRPPNNAEDVGARCPDLNGHLHLEQRHDSEDSKMQGVSGKDECLVDTFPAKLSNPYEFDGMTKRSSSGRCIKPKRAFDYIETGHRNPLEERSIRAHKGQRKIEHRDRFVKGHSREVKARLFDEHEDTLKTSLLNARVDGHMEKGLKGSEIVANDLNNGARSKTCNNSLLLASRSEQDQLSDVHMPYSGTAFIPPLVKDSLFSTLHLFSAVRAVLLDADMPDTEKTGCFPFREIVRRVGACPLDPRILEVQLPLGGLIKGVLKALSSTSKKHTMHKPFVVYDKSIRSWSWIGPVTGCSCDRAGGVRSFQEIWNTPVAVLDELQDTFNKWLKNTEKTLHQLWRLALLPLPAYPVLPDEQERFRDLRAQKSLTTIFPSSCEMRTLFRKEEWVRYSALEIAFRYTTADGQKSAVAPLRRLGARSKAKARDHFMLKQERPSHITILCLVRDAAARLPQSIGTRADVCILLRDSQFIVEDVPDLQLSQVVSGALDRLHYERDPCVRYDPDKKLWLYLHGNREEEDFEEGGTTSTRSSRRSKKDIAEAVALPAQETGCNDDMSEPEPDSGVFNGNGDARDSASPELLYDHQSGGHSSVVPGANGSHSREEVLLQFIDLPTSMQPFCGNIQSHPMGWEVYKGGNELSITQ